MGDKLERITITDSHHFMELIIKAAADDPRLFIIDVFSSWCGPCSSILPTMKTLFSSLDNFNDRCCYVACDAAFLPDTTTNNNNNNNNNSNVSNNNNNTISINNHSKTNWNYKHKPSSMPKFLLVKEGIIIDEINGANAPLLKQKIEKYAPPCDAFS